MTESKQSNTILILGFFDGIHSGHRFLISQAVEYANKNFGKTVLLTFSKSPSEYFNNSAEYIYPRIENYNIIKSLGVDIIVESEFESIINMSAQDFLQTICKKYCPIAIFTGFNYTFGKNRKGTPETLYEYKEKYNYKYYCVPAFQYQGEIVSSTLIKKILKDSSCLEDANKLLEKDFMIESKVIKGAQLGRKIGFPTANLMYPQNIVKLPYGVYKGEALGMPAIINWGIKPTVNAEVPLVEAHIIGFEEDLYGKMLKVSFHKRLRNEQKFNTLDELKFQIEKDREECLKL